MKPPSVVKLSFDPLEVTGDLKKVFDNNISKILWCCIKHQHITNQYFVLEILTAASALRDFDSSNYQKFLGTIPTLVSQFGRVSISQSFMFNNSMVDHEFWGGVFEYIAGKDYLRIEIEDTLIEAVPVPDPSASANSDYTAVLRAAIGDFFTMFSNKCLHENNMDKLATRLNSVVKAQQNCA